MGDGGDLSELTILDPACGDGVFVEQAASELKNRHRSLGARGRIYGVDIDADAVAAAEARLQNLASSGRFDGEVVLRQGDALVETPLATGAGAPPLDWQASFPEVFCRGGFDAIVGNPPYVNVRILSQSGGSSLKEYFKQQYACAHRAYDLYVLFIERAYHLLRPGGVCGLIVPNKVAEMEYAERCRELLLEKTTLLEIVDVSRLKLFAGASVYPYVLIWRKAQATVDHCLHVRRVQSAVEPIDATPIARIPQRELSAKNGFELHGRLDVESRVRTAPLRDRATLSSGTTGFAASQLAKEVVEREQLTRGAYHDFIVSGNIDRFSIRKGDVRFMKRQFRRPAVPMDAAVLSPRKRELFRQPKIVVAGMTQRLEAAWDQGGLALGVQVYAVAEFQDDPYYLLGLLNSKLMSYLFRMRFHAKRLSGGYFAVNKRQLEQLPIRLAERGALPEQHEISELVRRMSKLRPGRRCGAEGTHIDGAIDQLVYRIYSISADEVAAIEDEVS